MIAQMLKVGPLHHNCYCKHICFVLLRMFREIYTKESNIFISKIITGDEYNIIQNKLENLDINQEKDIVNEELLVKFRNLSSNNFKLEGNEKKKCVLFVF